MTEQAKRDALLPESLAAQQRSIATTPARPVPAKIGEPSVFRHVVYVLKENRTYDQVFGDIARATASRNCASTAAK